MKKLILTATVVAITGFTAINAQTTSPAQTKDTTSTSSGQGTTSSQGQGSTAAGTGNTGTNSSGTTNTGTNSSGTTNTGTNSSGTTTTGTSSTGATNTGTNSTGTATTGTNSAGTTTTGTAAPTGDVVQAISTSGYNASLTTAIKTAGLDQTLKGAGPFTVFAPSDQAFVAVPAGDSLLTQQAKLAKTLKHHVVVGQYTKDDIIKALTVGRGSTTLKTIDGDVLTLKVNASKNLELSDASGNTALVTVFDIKGTNGTAHVINNVLVPKQ